jgi:hypothetical protein
MMRPSDQAPIVLENRGDGLLGAQGGERFRSCEQIWRAAAADDGTGRVGDEQSIELAGYAGGSQQLLNRHMIGGSDRLHDIEPLGEIPRLPTRFTEQHRDARLSEQGFGIEPACDLLAGQFRQRVRLFIGILAETLQGNESDDGKGYGSRQHDQEGKMRPDMSRRNPIMPG